MSFEYENINNGDFNLTFENKNLEDFMNTFDLECLIKKPACFQSTSPSCIDFILTNKKEFLKNCNVSEVWISDHYCLIVTAFRSQLVLRAIQKRSCIGITARSMFNFLRKI